MNDSGRKWLYSLRRELHFTSGFVIRNAGEIGIFLFLILFGLLVMGFINGDSKPEYLLGLVAAFGAYAAFVTQQRGKMHDIMKGFDEDFSKLRATRRKLTKKLQDKNSQADGDSHFRTSSLEYDKERQLFIESFGIRFLRFTNNEVYRNLNGVLFTICEALKTKVNS